MLTTFDLPEVEDMWTLVGKHDERRRRETGLQDHSFLILSRQDSSLILRTEEEINELEESGFNTTSKTVFAGNVGNNRYIIQVRKDVQFTMKYERKPYFLYVFLCIVMTGHYCLIIL